MFFNVMREEWVDSIIVKLNLFDLEDLYSIVDIQIFFFGLFLENEGCFDIEFFVYVKVMIEDIDCVWYIRKYDNIIYELVFKFVYVVFRVVVFFMVLKLKQVEFEEVYKKISDGFGFVLLI